MNRYVILVLTGLLLIIAAIPVIGEEVETENLSAGRALGVGMEVGIPWVGLISGRYWVASNVGAEGILLMWGEPGKLTGSVTGRVLYRLSDTRVVDFYLACGVTYSFSALFHEGNTTFLSAAGGIEFSFPFAKSLAWNIEFGVTVTIQGELNMAGGTGIHFYF